MSFWLRNSGMKNSFKNCGNAFTLTKDAHAEYEANLKALKHLLAVAAVSSPWAFGF